MMNSDCFAEPAPCLFEKKPRKRMLKHRKKWYLKKNGGRES